MIAKNQKLIDYLVGENTLLSSKILGFEVYLITDAVAIDVHLELLYRKVGKHIKLRFLEVQEYSFYHNSQHYFYNVERFKFLITGDLVYISFDPLDESNEVDSHDQDFIFSKSVEGYWIP